MMSGLIPPKVFHCCPLTCHGVFDLVSETRELGEQGDTRKRGLSPDSDTLVLGMALAGRFDDCHLLSNTLQGDSSRSLNPAARLLADMGLHCCVVNFEEVFKW